MKKSLVFLVITLVLAACKTDFKTENKYEEDIEIRDPNPITKRTEDKILTTSQAIAYANGLKNWGNIKEIRYTFNMDRDSTHHKRSWIWKPKSNIVTLTTDKDTITYHRSKMDSISKKADQKFINDKYWLLAPFNLIWDINSFTSEHQIKAIAPISKTEMQKLTIVYKNEGGYTPGDAYDFYFKGDFIIREWVFRKENQSEPSLITSWEDYEDFDGIKIAKTHKRNEGDWLLYFTDIKVVTK